MHRGFSIAFLCLAGFLLFFLPAQAAEQKEPEKIVYAFDQNFPPYSFVQNGKASGFDVDLLEAALNRYNVELRYKPLPWEQVLVELSGGSAQVTTGMARTDQRQLLYHFSDRPTSTLKLLLYTKKSNRVATVEELRGSSVSVEKGSLYQRVIESFGGMIIRGYDTGVEALKALYADQTTAFAGADRTTEYLLDKLNMQGISSVGTPLSTTDVYVAVNRDKTDLLKKINEGLLRIRQTGEYDRIYRKWFVPDLTDTQRERLIAEAKKAAVNAYAPYSKRPLGAAVLTQSGEIFTGASVENALESLTASALRVAVYNALLHGNKGIKAAVAVSPDGRVQAPTAEERQILLEFGRGILAVTEPEPGQYEVHMISQLLPYGFDDRPIQPDFPVIQP